MALKRVIHPAIRRILRYIQALVMSILRNIYARIFRRLSVSATTGENLILNIGCGKLVREGWVNVDIVPKRGAFFLNAKKCLPFKDMTVLHIHCEHFLEHIDYPIAKFFLKECHRVLIPQGSIRLILPDAEKYFQAYCEKNAEFFEKLKSLGGAAEPFRTPIEIINQMFRMGGAHRFAWDFETLELNLRMAGFVNIQRSKFGDIQQRFNIDATDDWRITESIYIKTFK
jgi:predicted SAM-dependent methyltransferase